MTTCIGHACVHPLHCMYGQKVLSNNPASGFTRIPQGKHKPTLARTAGKAVAHGSLSAWVTPAQILKRLDCACATLLPQILHLHARITKTVRSHWHPQKYFRACSLSYSNNLGLSAQQHKKAHLHCCAWNAKKATLQAFQEGSPCWLHGRWKKCSSLGHNPQVLRS